MPERVRVLEPGGVTGFTEKPSVVPAGSSVTESVTGSSKSPNWPTLTVKVASSGAHTDTLAGLAPTVKPTWLRSPLTAASASILPEPKVLFGKTPAATLQAPAKVGWTAVSRITFSSRSTSPAADGT